MRVAVCAGAPEFATAAERLATVCKTQMGLTLGAGIGGLGPSSFRFGHMGHVNAPMVLGDASHGHQQLRDGQGDDQGHHARDEFEEAHEKPPTRIAEPRR